MEMNPRRIGKYHEQIVSKLEKEEQGSEDQLQGRAYTCSFCKRGFSSAQALGGHMNIHRKDRAKLRLTSEEDDDDDDDDQSQLLQHSVEDMPRKKINDPLIHPDHYHHPSADHYHHPSADHHHQLNSTDHDDQDKEYCCTAGIEKLNHHQLSLFSEKPSQSYDQSPIYCSADAGGHDQERIIRHTHPPSSLKELDLELRLGPEPGP